MDLTSCDKFVTLPRLQTRLEWRTSDPLTILMLLLVLATVVYLAEFEFIGIKKDSACKNTAPRLYPHGVWQPTPTIAPAAAAATIIACARACACVRVCMHGCVRIRRC